MRTFKDSRGDEWEIALPFGTVMRVRQAAGGRFDLLEPFGGDPTLQDRLRTDVVEFWELLQILTEPQQKARGISAEEFGLRMTADCLVDACDTFFTEWSEFFRKSQRHDVGEALARIRAVQAKAVATMREKIASDPAFAELEAIETKKIDSDLTKAFDTLRQDLQSIHSPTPGASSPG